MSAWCRVVANDEKNGRDRNDKSGLCAFCSLSLSFELVDRLKGNYRSEIEIESMLIYFNVLNQQEDKIWNWKFVQGYEKLYYIWVV